MLTELLKEQLASLLGKLSVFYGSTSLLNTMQEQINQLKTNSETEKLYEQYQTDFNKLKTENEQLSVKINEILSMGEDIAELKSLMDFSLTTDYLTKISDNSGTLNKLGGIIPDTLTSLNNHIENIYILNNAILNLSSKYSLNFNPMTIKTKVILVISSLILFIAIFYLIKKGKNK